MANNNPLIGQLTAKAKNLEAELRQARMALKNKSSAGSRKEWLYLDPSIQPKEEEETWFATYLDMMTLLLVLMIVMLAFAGTGNNATSTTNLEATNTLHTNSAAQTAYIEIDSHPNEKAKDLVSIAKATSTARQGKEDLNHLGFEELGDDIDIILNDQSVSFRINSEILFPSGQADLSLAGTTVLKKLIPVLQKNNYQIAVEGHTDSIPIRSHRFPSNWELSGSRAGSVVRYFEANGISSMRLRAIGYADTKPLQSNQSTEGRAANRRVELTMDRPQAE